MRYTEALEKKTRLIESKGERMAKNKEMDPGLKYEKELGLERIRGVYGLYDRWVKLFGKEKAIKLFEEREKYPDGSPELYEFKNSDPLISRSYTEGYDIDIIRKACNYVAENKGFFGKTILEVGCDAGYMTGFLAKTFPDSKIISIDRSESAMNIAKANLEKLDVHNVELKHCSLKDVREQFDTVFCMRTIQENIDREIMPFYGEPFMYQCYAYADVCEDYTNQLKARLYDEGTLVVFERVGHDPLMCGWLLDLNRKEIGINYDSYEEIKCEEAGNTNTFQAFVCEIGNTGEESDVFELWMESANINPNGKNTLKNWNALVYLDMNAGELIKGIRVYDEDGKKQIGRFGIFSDNENENTMYYLNAPGGDEVTLLSYNASLKDQLLNQLDQTEETNKKLGFIIKDIDPKEPDLEGDK